MGYYTNYGVEVEGVDAAAATDALIEKSQYRVDKNGDTSFRIWESKWYGWEKDVAAVSKKFPDALFTISGAGEVPEDIWEAWARNGDVEKVSAKIVVPEPAWVPKAKAMLAAKVAQKVEADERARLAELQAKYGEDA